MSRYRRAVIVSLVLGGVGLTSLGIWLFVRADQRAIRTVAGRLLDCPPDHIEVLSSDTSDTAELYRVRGCGHEARLICSAPDFECALEPREAPPR